MTVASGGAQNGGAAIWVWGSTSGSDANFRHPSDLPADPEAARSVFVGKQLGPRAAKISPATLVQAKATTLLIAEQGATREIHKSLVLPWYEGLLLLEELDAAKEKDSALEIDWIDESLQTVLEQERKKLKNGHLSGALYAERRLLNTAVTGKAGSYRRDHTRSEAPPEFDGEAPHGLYKMREILGYIPPWEAFCNERCGFYQDFYKVRWEYPFSDVDYAKVENGCVDVIGTTWEPDECLVPSLDALRIDAKRAWIKLRREAELKAAERPTRDEADGPPLKRLKSGDLQDADTHGAKSAIFRRRRKEDGAPLERDLLRCSLGHDFSPGTIDTDLVGVRKGWPKTKEDYPPGYSCADPPGFCGDTCDCMDDQRPQRSWELRKAWLEDPTRSAASLRAIEVFSSQARFVRRRGTVSNMCFFETAASVQARQPDATSAAQLADVISYGVAKVMRSIPISALRSGDAVNVPCAIYLAEQFDYEPLGFDAAPTKDGSAPPTWLQVGPDDGSLSATTSSALARPINFGVEFTHSDGVSASASCSIVPEPPGPKPTSPWVDATAAIVSQFSILQMGKGAYSVLKEHLQVVYNFDTGVAQECTFGQWLGVMTRMVRMLRSLTCAHICLPQG